MALFWTKTRVETLWKILEQNSDQYQVLGYRKFWAMIATKASLKLKRDLSAKACINKANEVHKMGRPYPWELSDIPNASLLIEGKRYQMTSNGITRTYTVRLTDDAIRLSNINGDITIWTLPLPPETLSEV